MKNYILLVDTLAYNNESNLLYVPDLVFASDSLETLFSIDILEIFHIVKDYCFEKFNCHFAIEDFSFECSFGITSDISTKEFLKDIENCDSVLYYER